MEYVFPLTRLQAEFQAEQGKRRQGAEQQLIEQG